MLSNTLFSGERDLYLFNKQKARRQGKHTQIKISAFTFGTSSQIQRSTELGDKP